MYHLGVPPTPPPPPPPPPDSHLSPASSILALPVPPLQRQLDIKQVSYRGAGWLSG